jgi:hypothetical protein
VLAAADVGAVGPARPDFRRAPRRPGRGRPTREGAGRECWAGDFTDDISSWDGELYPRVGAGTAADVTLALTLTLRRLQFPGWSEVGAFGRLEIFLRAAD